MGTYNLRLYLSRLLFASSCDPLLWTTELDKASYVHEFLQFPSSYTKQKWKINRTIPIPSTSLGEIRPTLSFAHHLWWELRPRSQNCVCCHFLSFDASWQNVFFLGLGCCAACLKAAFVCKWRAGELTSWVRHGFNSHKLLAAKWPNCHAGDFARLVWRSIQRTNSTPTQQVTWSPSGMEQRDRGREREKQKGHDVPNHAIMTTLQ